MQRLLLGLQTASNQACEQIDDEVEWATMARLRAISLGERTMNRIAIARQYVGELLHQRQDIIAAWIGGSVARGEDTALSDIDLRLMVPGTGPMSRAELDVWREGIFIEGALVFQQNYANPEAVLNSPFKATEIYDALILYDPTGFVTQLQQSVRPVYMQPQWLGKRLAYWLESARTAFADFRKAVEAVDALHICAALGMFTYACSSIPLLRAGITPSSTRALLQLGPIAPTLKTQLAEFEGLTQRNAGDVLALEPILREASPLFNASWGQEAEYLIAKALWMAQQGQHQAALHVAWVHILIAARDCLQRNNPVELVAGTDVMQRWLHRNSMHEPALLAEKIQGAEILLQQVEVLVNEIGGD